MVAARLTRSPNRPADATEPFLNDLRSVDVTKIRTALQELTAAVRGQLEADQTNAK